ncbi:hypothetical protein FXV83_02395 [Bradyrhizobium hipponense]|uniref:Uncharacterized protein n=1 Tax=Bradyrhizobium hipponense TaxID=2605638 RepID=A0A5S4YWP0_9BRAD|nr:hypothetical protein [Bradyrhizobium hipponense]TYO68125.1 hypothetical protein FXV83_02395 [Bradyrhizobium hipponense]
MQRDIDAATKIRERLSAQIVEFEQAISHQAAGAKQAALTGDHAGLDRVEAAVGSRANEPGSDCMAAPVRSADAMVAILCG